MTSALEILSEFDHQASEDMLLNILKKWWPQVHEGVINCCVETSAFEDEGDADYLAGILEALQICWMKGTKVSKPLFVTGTEQRKIKEYLTIGQILLEIRKRFYGKIHPMLTKLYLRLAEAHNLLGNVAWKEECFELCEQCKNGEGTEQTQCSQGLPPYKFGMYRARELNDRGGSLFKEQNYYGAMKAYTEALRVSPNDAKVLTNRAASYHKLSQQKCSSPEDKQKMLEQALVDSQRAITVDPSWAKGYYRKAVSLALLGRRGPSLATAAIARYLFPSRCANIPAVVDYFGNFEVHVVKTVQDLQTATEKTDTKAKKLESKNKVVLLKEGEYLLERSVGISEDIVIVSHGKVSIACKTGAPFLFKAAYHVENVEMATDCDTQEESQDCSSNDNEPEVIQFYQGLPTVDSTIYSDREISDRAKSLFEAQEYYAAAEAYSEALRLSPNNAKLLTNRAASYHKLSEQKCSSPEDKQKMLVQALADSQKAITVDPSWSKGYYRKAVSLALLGRRGPSLATAVIARHLFPSRCANISIVVDHFGDYDSHVVKTVQDLQTAIEKIDIKSKMPARKNKVVLIKEGEYLLERSVDISGDIVIVGHGKVSVACKTGEPFHFKAAYHVENVKMATDCDRHEESQECSPNHCEPEVIRLATPSGYDNNSYECKVN
ncbi:stress-induced-phosphoprotein 1-like [Stylophora pistillata]|uniref:stress-induced-phosphoprotein 1-like n=1 Tax=Stylophora pistillata TaxID=50429 RepID=UPI000C040D6D|nr:stress-induced-phosphoprotein 1-like [Stylophora pistillata]